MFQKLVSHNHDIEKLVHAGYAVSFDSNYLIIRDIPYLDDQKQIKTGTIVTKVEFIDQYKVQQQNHQVFFAGGIPHNVDGTQIRNLGNSPCSLALSPSCKDIIVERSFSNKPKKTGRFKDFFEKIESYVTIISGPAMHLFDVTPYTFRTIDSISSESVFKFSDTLTSRAEIIDLAGKFKEDTVAIIGLGGTGGYVLDLMVKTPVHEIRAFDLDQFCVHNAFRSPGRLQSFELGMTKSDVYKSRYENFRENLKIESKYIDSTSDIDLENVTFAFVCVDSGPSRKEIFEILIRKNIPFIDVGMGIQRIDGMLNGMLRTTYYSVEENTRTVEEGLAELNESPEDLYKTNIQIGELNALNACLAVIKFKQLRGFYLEEERLYHLLFEISDLKIVGTSYEEQD